jgi:predicted dehydrogenase
MSGVHAKNIAALDGAEVSAVCDLNEDAADSIVTSAGGPGARAFTDFDSMLNGADLDALYVCIPPGAHSGQVEAAAERGIHLFLEKPIAVNVERGQSMVRAAEKAGVVAAVGYMCRHGYAIEKLKAMIEDGTAGRPTLFEGRFWCNALHGPWWRRREMSGGQILEQAIHVYDLALYLMGRPQVATGFAANLCHQDVENYTVEDTSVASIRFESGALAAIHASNCAVPMEWTHDYRVVCEKVTAIFRDPNEAEFIFTGGEGIARHSVSAEKDLMASEDANFLASIRGDAEPHATIQEGLLGVQLTSAVLQSAESDGAPVRIQK